MEEESQEAKSRIVTSVLLAAVLQICYTTRRSWLPYETLHGMLG
jgi:hypothetical protein